MLSLGEAAVLAGTSPKTLSRAIGTGKLAARRTVRGYEIDPQAACAFSVGLSRTTALPSAWDEVSAGSDAHRS